MTLSSAYAAVVLFLIVVPILPSLVIDVYCGVRNDKAQAEHNESAHPPIADMTADIDYRPPCITPSLSGRHHLRMVSCG